MVMGFEKTFLVQAVAFLIVLPLLFFLRVGDGKKTDSAPSTHVAVE
jgi:hypothetical protein